MHVQSFGRGQLALNFAKLEKVDCDRQGVILLSKELHYYDLNYILCIRARAGDEDGSHYLQAFATFMREQYMSQPLDRIYLMVKQYMTKMEQVCGCLNIMFIYICGVARDTRRSGCTVAAVLLSVYGRFRQFCDGCALDVAHLKLVILFANITSLNSAVMSYVMSECHTCIGHVTFHYKRSANTSVGVLACCLSIRQVQLYHQRPTGGWCLTRVGRDTSNAFLGWSLLPSTVIIVLAMVNSAVFPVGTSSISTRPRSAALLPVNTTSTGLLRLSVGTGVHCVRSDTEKYRV